MAKIISYHDDILQICCNENLPWDKLNGCNILVTGSTGLIGGCMVETLMENPRRNYHVYASGRNEERARTRFSQYTDDDAFHFVRYDVMHPLESDISFDYIIHAASGAGPSDFSHKPVEVMKSNIEGVSHLIDYGLAHEMKRFLYVSSGEVYGEGDGCVFEEDYSGYVNPTLSRSCYPSSKRAAETLCVSYAEEYGANIVISRPCHVYGPHFTASDSRVYAQFIRNVLRGEDIVMKSTGEQFRSWCYVVDCVSALLYVLLKGECGEAYNIANAESNISIKELANFIAEIGGKKVVFDIPNDDEKRGYNVVRKSVYSTMKIESLGWTPKTNIYEGIEKTIKALVE